MIGDIDKSEDIVQDVFVKLWKHKIHLESQHHIKSYMYTMVRNHTIEVIRRDHIGSKINKEILHLYDHESESQINEAELENFQLLDQIYVSIRQLPPKCGEVFTMAKVNGLSYAQIAEIMNISVKTVEAHMSKALKLLRDMLSNSVKS